MRLRRSPIGRISSNHFSWRASRSHRSARTTSIPSCCGWPGRGRIAESHIRIVGGGAVVVMTRSSSTSGAVLGHAPRRSRSRIGRTGTGRPVPVHACLIRTSQSMPMQHMLPTVRVCQCATEWNCVQQRQSPRFSSPITVSHHEGEPESA